MFSPAPIPTLPPRPLSHALPTHARSHPVAQGFFIRAKAIPDYLIWMHWISFQKYTFEVALVNDLKDQIIQCQAGTPCFCAFQPAVAGACTFSGNDVLRFYGYEDVEVWEWLVVLLAQFVFFRILVYLALRFKPFAI